MVEEPNPLVEPRRRRTSDVRDRRTRYLVEKYGIGEDLIQDLIDQYGHRRKKLDAAARRLAD
jgi:hypothetical protein